MEILEIQTHIELKKARNNLIYAVISMMACMILMLFTQFQSIFNLLIFIVLCYSLYAVYEFSKLTNTYLFRYYTFMLFAQFVASFLLPILESIMPFALSLLATFVFIHGCNIYFTYKMSHEMNVITDLPHFITAFKLYVLSSCGVFIAAIFAWFGLDTNNMLSNTQEATVTAFVESNMYLLIAFLCLFIVLFATFCISAGFMLRGLIKMSYVKVRSVY